MNAEDRLAMLSDAARQAIVAYQEKRTLDLQYAMGKLISSLHAADNYYSPSTTQVRHV